MNRSDGMSIDLDALSIHWRLALDREQDVLNSLNRSGTSIRFAPEELRRHAARLVEERADVGRLIDYIARSEHVRLRHRLAMPRASRQLLDLPPEVEACVFDLDGVLTASSHVHAAAWAATFDEFVSRWGERTGEPQFPIARFTPTDYRLLVHGRPRLEGIHGFLASRGIRLPPGAPGDAPGSLSVHGLANRKNAVLLRLLSEQGVSAFAGSLRFLEVAEEVGLVCTVVTASTNAEAILADAGLAHLLAQWVDGNMMRAEGLRAKPAPDAILAACRRLGVDPAVTVGFDTSSAGIAACRAAGLCLTVGVDRGDQAVALRREGADRVVADLTELLDPSLTS